MQQVEFQLVGIILGAAIYNGVILPVHFPPVLYMKLLGQKPGFKELKESMPSLARGLQQLLDFEGDVESTFSLNFQVCCARHLQRRQVVLSSCCACIEWVLFIGDCKAGIISGGCHVTG